MPRHAVLLLAVLLLLRPAHAAAQEYTIKFATVSPEGSTWMNVMHEFDAAIRKESGGRLGFKMYAGGVQGDEKDVMRKIRLGQLHSAGITGVGMTGIAPKARILDSPFLFRSTEEVDYITRKFDAELKGAFEENGFVNLGWAEVGWTYVYTNTPVRVPDDMKKVKMWMWEGDPIAEASFGALGLHPISLTLTDVLTSLQTGLIDGVYAPPLALIALQWFSQVKYMLDAPLADACGAVVIAKKKFDELPPDLRAILTRNVAVYMAKITKLSREDNARAVGTLKKNGVTLISPAPDAERMYDRIGVEARARLTGKLYPKEFLDRVEAALAEYRSHPGK